MAMCCSIHPLRNAVVGGETKWPVNWIEKKPGYRVERYNSSLWLCCECMKYCLKWSPGTDCTSCSSAFSLEADSV